MIAHIRGKIEEKFGNNGIIVDVSGVGYEMLVPTPDFEACTLGEERKFYTYHAVKENSEELYGFSSLLAKKLFELLISVQGVYGFPTCLSRNRLSFSSLSSMISFSPCSFPVLW